MKLSTVEQRIAKNASDRLFELRRNAYEENKLEGDLISLSAVEVEGLQKLFEAAAGSNNFPASFFPGLSTLVQGINDRLREQQQSKDRRAFDEVIGTIQGTTP